MMVGVKILIGKKTAHRTQRTHAVGSPACFDALPTIDTRARIDATKANAPYRHGKNLAVQNNGQFAWGWLHGTKPCTHGYMVAT
jgi:hypothetical protein